jgi:UrcA family protein
VKISSKLVLCAAVLAVAPAYADVLSRNVLTEAAVTRTESVKFKPSEVSTAEGASALYRQLREAAARVCTEEAAFAFDVHGYETCVVDALNTAVKRVSIPLVSTLHQQSARSATVAGR